MNEIIWENPYQRFKNKWGMKNSKNIENTLSDADIPAKARRSNSFAARFLSDNPDRLASSYRDVTSPPYQEYHRTSIEQNSFEQEGEAAPQKSGTVHKNGFFQSHAENQQTEFSTHTAAYTSTNFIHTETGVKSGQLDGTHNKWRFFDLKSRKPTGDLFKKIIAYKKKSNYSTFCFTSSTPKEGVTTILANLAHYIRYQGSKHNVILVDANLESPGMNKIFGIPAYSPGLMEVLEGNISLESLLVPVADNIGVLCSGHVKNFNRNSLDPEVFYRFIQQCKTVADYVLIDCPPILVSSDVFSVAPASDITFLVVEAVKIRRQVVEKGISELRNNESEIGGILMNRVQQVIPGWVYRFI